MNVIVLFWIWCPVPLCQSLVRRRASAKAPPPALESVESQVGMLVQLSLLLILGVGVTAARGAAQGQDARSPQHERAWPGPLLAHPCVDSRVAVCRRRQALGGGGASGVGSGRSGGRRGCSVYQTQTHRLGVFEQVKITPSIWEVCVGRRALSGGLGDRE